jgi:glycosyltransferase involved in cell wall biosynthesis
MPLRAAAFAIPGDMRQKTGGYIYEYELLMALRAQGRAVEHVQLAEGFPDSSPAQTLHAVEAMCAIGPDVPLIIDGLVFGSIDTAGLAKVRAPIVAMIHHPLGLETGLSGERSRALLEREGANLQLADHVLVPSPHTARIIASAFSVPREKITIASPGFRPSDPVHTPSEPPLILSVGLLAERKGHDILVAALGRLTHLAWRAEIVGNTHDPQVEARLRQQIIDLGLAERITLTGLVSDEAVIDKYRSATIFALATRYEGYGIVLGEAQIHGLPIVTCRVGAVPDTVSEGSGFLVPVDDVEAFAEGLEVLLANPSVRNRMAAQSARAGHRLLGWDNAARQVGTILDNLSMQPLASPAVAATLEDRSGSV